MGSFGSRKQKEEFFHGNQPGFEAGIRRMRKIMRKTFEQIILEGQASKCVSMEELFVLWQLMQQMEEHPVGTTCYREIDPRSFHIDGAVSPADFTGTLYILKEPNMRKAIQKGQSLPVISDVRKDILKGRSPSGEVEYLSHLLGMQKILSEQWKIAETKEHTKLLKGPQAIWEETGASLKNAAVLYINKRGGKGAADEISLDYGQYYIEFIKRQIRLLSPRRIICCGEDIFRLIVMEVFQNKKMKKNREIYMKWKDLVRGDIFLADSRYLPVKEEKQAALCVLRMWNPAYRVNNRQYVSLEEYLNEFARRLAPSRPD